MGLDYAFHWVFPNDWVAIGEISLTLTLSMWYFGHFNGMDWSNKVRNSQKLGGATAIMIFIATLLEYINESAAKQAGLSYSYARMWLPLVFFGGGMGTIMLGDWIVFILYLSANRKLHIVNEHLADTVRKFKKHVMPTLTLVIVALVLSSCDLPTTNVPPQILTAVAHVTQTAAARGTDTPTPVIIDVTATPSETPTASASDTPIVPTATFTPSIVEVPTCPSAAPCEIPSPFPTVTAIPTQTEPPTPTGFKTPTPIVPPATASPAPSSTSAATLTPRATSTRTPIPSPTPSRTPTQRPTPTPSPTATATQSPTPRPTSTPIVPSATPASTAAPTPTAQPSPTVAPGGPQPFAFPGTWRMVFDDEFNGTSLDLNHFEPGWFWQSGNPYTQHIASGEGECFSQNNIIVANGEADLKLDAGTCPASAGTSAGFPYIGAAMTTRTHFTFTYGIAEARIWFPGANVTQSENWDAFWINGLPVSDREEYDIAESLGNHLCFHLNPGSVSGGCNGSVAISGGWHVFSIQWDKTGATVKYDLFQIGRITTTPYNAPMYIIFQNATHGQTGVTAPSVIRVDYVRVFQP